MPLIVQPVARNVPSSFARSSTPKRKSTAINIRADPIKNKLKPINRNSNGVVPAAACSPICLTASKRNPRSSCRLRNCDRNRSATISWVIPVDTGRRKEVVEPKRLPHHRFPSASAKNALGVVRCKSQYSSSASLMRLWSKGKGGSQSSIEAWSVMPSTVGVRSGSFASVGSSSKSRLPSRRKGVAGVVSGVMAAN